MNICAFGSGGAALLPSVFLESVSCLNMCVWAVIFRVTWCLTHPDGSARQSNQMKLAESFEELQSVCMCVWLGVDYEKCIFRADQLFSWIIYAYLNKG